VVLQSTQQLLQLSIALVDLCGVGVEWAALVELIAPYYPEGKNGRPPFALETMLRIHCMQQWFTLSDLAMEEAFFDTPIYREFAGLMPMGGCLTRAPS
jgi:hypothetical protein